jgi:hypothetical protein
MKYTPSSGPYFVIFALLALFYFHVPKMPNASNSYYSLLGLVFSEKSWIYLLSTQLLLSEGFASILPSLIGLAAGYLYDVDWFGSQTFRLPQRVERFLARIEAFFSSVGPQPLFLCEESLMMMMNWPQRKMSSVLGEVNQVMRVPPAAMGADIAIFYSSITKCS